MSSYEITDHEWSTSLDLLGPRTKTLAEREYHNVLSNPQRFELYNAVVNDDVTKVNQFFDSGIDMNLGLAANRPFTKLLLGAAIENDNDEILQVLITNKAKIGGSLFTAVRQGSYKCIKYLLKILEKSTLVDEYDLGPNDCKPEGFITPLMMAIQMGDHTLVEYLITQGYQVKNEGYVYDEGMKNDLGIPLPIITRDMKVMMRKKKAKKLLPKEHSILLKIDTYKSLANPLYISYMFIHDKTTLNPLYQVFMLSRELKFRASIDDEFKEDYYELTHNLEDFAVDLMEQCRTLREIKTLTDIAQQSEKRPSHIEIRKETAKELEFINLGTKGNNDKLVAHPYSQLCLNMVLYKDIYTIFNSEPNWRDRSSFSVFLYTFRHILLLPFMALIHIIAPCTKISHALGNPVIKFMSHFWSMLTFVILLVVSAFQDKFDKEIFKPSIPDWLIMVWVLGLIVQELKELYIQGKRRYFSQWWNTVTFLMVLLFTISYVLRLIAYGITGNWVVLDPIKDLTPSATFKTILLSNSLFSIAMVLSFLRISAVFQANDKLGPLQLSLYHLILDVMKFLVFFGLIIISFGFSLRKLYSHYISTQNYIRAASQRGVNGTKIQELNATHPFTDVVSGLNGLFWSLFGLTDLQLFSTKGDNFLITKETGQILFGLFQVLGVIIAINMLIAMMTRSFDDIADNAIKKWKVSRTRLWMFWVEKGSILPPPLNLIPNTRFIYKQIKKLCSKCCKNKDEEGRTNEGFSDIDVGHEDASNKLSPEKRHRKIKDILKRYIGMRKIRDNYENETQSKKLCRGCCSRKKHETTDNEDKHEVTAKPDRHEVTAKPETKEKAQPEEDGRETSEITLSF